jgi:hypothetical protein
MEMSDLFIILFTNTLKQTKMQNAKVTSQN